VWSKLTQDLDGYDAKTGNDLAIGLGSGKRHKSRQPQRLIAELTKSVAQVAN